jgi:hypothetical protein
VDVPPFGGRRKRHADIRLLRIRKRLVRYRAASPAVQGNAWLPTAGRRRQVSGG